MRYVFALPALLLIALPLIAADPPEAPEPADVKLESIFNGTDLTGWVVPDKNVWWKAEDGVLVCQSGPNLKESTLWTQRSYKDFVVECEFRFEGSIDSGIFLRSDKAQVQIGDSGSLKRDMTGSIYVPGKGYPKEAKGATDLLKPAGEWNHVRTEVRGDEYRVWLNGQHVLTYTGEGAPAEGPIGLQLHGKKEMRIEFRNLRAGEGGSAASAAAAKRGVPGARGIRAASCPGT